MNCARKIADNVYAVGVSDRRLERFENLFPLPNGVTYNSYLIAGEKTILVDTVDHSVIQPFFDNVVNVLQGRDLDYLIINHMEPDHCAAIELLVKKYPNIRLIGNAKTFQFLEQFYQISFQDNYNMVKDGDELTLGDHQFQFFLAPMVHWPEVMFTYEKTQKMLFSADAFGTFGASHGDIFADESDFMHDYMDETRRYYTNIVGKYGPQVQSALKKVKNLEFSMICPLHGPIWRKDIDVLLEKYQLWSTYTPEKRGVVFASASMYGNTERAALLLADKLAQRGVNNLQFYDISKTNASYLISAMFEYSHVVLSAPTYNMGLYYPMHALMHEMAALNIQNRSVALIGNGSWAPGTSIKYMQEMLGEMKGMQVLGDPLSICSTLKNEEVSKLDALADLIAASVQKA